MRIHENGYITDPDFHDGYLTGIRVVQENTLVLFLTHVDGRAFVLQAPDLYRLKADDFLNGNIIFDMEVASGAECPFDELKTLCEYDGYDEDHFADFYSKVCQDNWTYLTIDSSYGCTLSALHSVPFDQFQLVRDSANTQSL